jgi:23S rRNA (guanosine2251-2'-O)-methyltransferase
MQVALVSNLGNVVRDLKEDGVRVAGLEGVSEATMYHAADLSGSLALVVGGEDEGLSRLIHDLCDVLIRIPMYGRVGSLNAGVAAAIALFEARRQQENLLRHSADVGQKFGEPGVGGA